MVSLIVRRWSPEGLTAEDVANIMREYGLDNDSLLAEKHGENVVEWEIVVHIERVENLDTKAILG